MHKSIALIGLAFFAQSVLAPTVANAQMDPDSVATSTADSVSGMTTNPVSSVQELPASLASYLVTLTSYNAVPDQTSPTPWITASGAPSNPEVVAARSRDLASELPYGTIIAIDAPSDEGTSCGYSTVQHLIGYRVIADSMAKRMHDKIDVQLDQNESVDYNGQPTNPSVVLGACDGVTIHVVGYVNPDDIPQTQSALANLVTANSNLASKEF